MCYVTLGQHQGFNLTVIVGVELSWIVKTISSRRATYLLSVIIQVYPTTQNLTYFRVDFGLDGLRVRCSSETQLRTMHIFNTSNPKYTPPKSEIFRLRTLRTKQ